MKYDEYMVAKMFKRLNRDFRNNSEEKVDDIFQQTADSINQKIEACPKCACGGFCKWKGPNRLDYHDCCGGDRCDNLGFNNGFRTNDKATRMAISHRMKKIWKERQKHGQK